MWKRVCIEVDMVEGRDIISIEEEVVAAFIVDTNDACRFGHRVFFGTN